MPALKTVSIEGTGRAWVEVSEAALRENGRAFLEAAGRGSRLLPMVKANGYGVGVHRALRALQPLEPWAFGVATVSEGCELRRSGWPGRVIVFSPCAVLDAEALIEARLEPVVTDRGAMESLEVMAAALGRELDVHLEIDSGMGRFGVPWAEADVWVGWVERALRRGRLTLASTFTHYHSAADAVATRGQWERYQEALARMRARGIDPGKTHAAGSVAALAWPGLRADLVRPGLALYGGNGLESRFRPRPVISVRARVLRVWEAPAGATVSYGATYVTPAPARLATLGIGYADGLRRELSNRGEALLGGGRAPMRGTICMDTTVVDVTGLGEVRSGDVATLLGRVGEQELELEEMARRCGTISYEILTGWSARLPRIDGDAVVDGLGEECLDE